MAGDKTLGRLPGEWEPYFRKANVRVEDLDACKSTRSKTIKIGRFLSPNVGREVPIQVKGRTGRAVLRVEEGRSKEKRYYFDIIWDDQTATPTTPEKPPATKKNPRRATKGEKAMKGKTATPSPATEPATKEENGQSQATNGGNTEDW